MARRKRFKASPRSTKKLSEPLRDIRIKDLPSVDAATQRLEETKRKPLTVRVTAVEKAYVATRGRDLVRPANDVRLPIREIKVKTLPITKSAVERFEKDEALSRLGSLGRKYSNFSK